MLPQPSTSQLPEASTSQLPQPSTSQLPQSSSNVANAYIRERPVITEAPNAPPIFPLFLHLHHPVNDRLFLFLPAHDFCAPDFGMHYGTAATACRILAYNERGYLSASRTRNPSTVNVEWDSFLTPGVYYYHLYGKSSDTLYPICDDFSLCAFPHNDLPSPWDRELVQPPPVVWPKDWTAISVMVQAQDTECLVSGSKESLTTSYIVPAHHRLWVYNSSSSQYLAETPALEDDRRNLFTLRWDLHEAQFDCGTFVIVPKNGQLVVHFLQNTIENAQRYHNVTFDHKDAVANQLLYARFAWALMEIVKEQRVDVTVFDPGGRHGGGRGGGARGKRKAKTRPAATATDIEGPAGNLRNKRQKQKGNTRPFRSHLRKLYSSY
ncbi:hypothetical protein M413DRAFT_407799 [Hebeloma cylindrosporum]|uniref:HNH nuclease domain-containing protein n=1 Tax=Hebeloma cylindrosporum TaxID=76867 RepID=A0A0C3CLQ6_HEBCY|nr:hypothetical protein M413DRAFT_407799 [Hebeloma cylindrosporum h7]